MPRIPKIPAIVAGAGMGSLNKANIAPKIVPVSKDKRAVVILFRLIYRIHFPAPRL